MTDWLDDVVAPRESGGRPNIGWRNTDLTPWIQAGKTIYGFPDWPGLPGPEGNSTAAGLYGITKTNWKNWAPKLGIADFSPASQRKVADAILATQGKSAWAASEPGYKSGLRSFGRPEGLYGGRLNVTVRPPGVEFPIDSALDALLSGDPTEGEEADPFEMLDELLGVPQEAAAPAAAESAPVEMPAAPQRASEPSRIAEPLDVAAPAPVQGLAQPGPQQILDQLLGTPATAPQPAPTPSVRDVDVGTGIPLQTGPAVNPLPPETLLDKLLGAAGDIGTAAGGLAERTRLGALNVMRPPGQMRQPEPFRGNVPMEKGLRATEGALTFAMGGLPMGVGGTQGAAQAARGAQEAGRIAQGVSRETSAAMPAMMASQQGATRLPGGIPSVPPQFEAAAKRAKIDRAAQRELAEAHAKQSGVPVADVVGNLERSGADPTLWWFLDGNKQIYSGPISRVAEVQNAGRTKELARYGRVDIPGGAVWYKPGAKDAADETAALLSKEGKTEADHRRLGELLGYPKESVDQYLSARGAGGGGAPPRQPPPTGGSGPPEPPPRDLRSLFSDERSFVEARKAVEDIRNLTAATVRDAQIKAVPMTAGEPAGQAVAKDWANNRRVARHWRNTFDKPLRKLSPQEQRTMWEAMDNASVAAQEIGGAEGIVAGMKFIHALPDGQQKLLLDMERRGIELWERARVEGMVAEGAERLPFYVMRGVLEVGGDGAFSRLASRAGQGPGMTGLDQFGVNLTARGPMTRGFLTSAETEAAAQAKFGENAEIVRNIRVLPMAYERFENAISTREMINDLKRIGETTGRPTVAEGEQLGSQWFTLDHPAFKTYQPRMRLSNETGKVEPLRDPETGKIIMDRLPLYVSREFEGPLKAIATHEVGPIYSALMQLKGASMATIMNSPMIHNQVEWGRALGAMPGKVATFRVYGIGKEFMADPRRMERAIKDGLVPIGERGYMQDIEGIARGADLQPGQGLLARGVGAIADIASPKAGDLARRGIDAAGEFWHQKLLWDQVAKLQAGLYSEFSKNLIAKGVDPSAAGKIAAHLANRYAGALPAESMSENARKILNVALFSRSFTIGNLGVLKDLVNGLPRDVRAQLGRELTKTEAAAVSGIARNKAITTVLTDVALAYVANALLQDGMTALRDDPDGALGRGSVGAAGGMLVGRLGGGVGGAVTGGVLGGLGGAITGDIDRIADEYVERFHALLQKAKENPVELINPLDTLMALLPASENEPGKEERFKVGYREDRAAAYGRTGIGKIGEEFAGWVFKPLQMVKNKWGTAVRPLLNIYNNDKGFGEKIYNEHPRGVGDVLGNFGAVMMELGKAQLPVQQLEAAARSLGIYGEAPPDWFDAAQALGPFAGVTFSRGAPGGEAVGEMYGARAEHDAKLKAALPKIRDLVKGGKYDEAQQKLEDLQVPPKLQRYYMKVYGTPEARLSPRAMRDFQRYSTPEQQRRMEMQMRRRDQRELRAPAAGP